METVNLERRMRGDMAAASEGSQSTGRKPKPGSRMRTIGATALKEIAYATGLHRLLFYRYDYMFRPRELAYLASCVTRTQGLAGPILEIGCAAGHTTVFLNKHLDDLEDPRAYVCIDTFAGFTDQDISVESGRGKDASSYAHLFRSYRKKWFDQTMANNEISRVWSIQADVNAFDFAELRDISFCLIDVDLTRPVARSLEEVFPRMAPGGIIVVDDCRPDDEFDGARAAYLQAVDRLELPVDIRFDKLGIIEVPESGA
jgi:SAM-dependent methyltransferase